MSGVFTKEELNIMAEGVLALINNATEALRLVVDEKSVKAIKESMKSYSQLVDKISSMQEVEQE